MSLLPTFLWDIDHVAQVEGELSVRAAVFDALIALEKKYFKTLFLFNISAH